MNPIQKIRRLYTPIQPSIRASTDGVNYSQHLPDQRLQNFIYCYWELKTNTKLSNPFIYRVVTDGCIDIFFETSRPSENFVMGFCRKYTEFPLEPIFHYVGIRFLPTAFTQIFNVDAAKLSDQFQLLRKVAPDFSASIGAQFNHRIATQKLVPILDNLLLTAIEKMEFKEDGRLYDAIDIILSNFGVVNVETALTTGISQRQLRRLFKYYIGTTPKSFAKVVRFQNILKSKPSTQSLRRNKLFYDFGYFDQAHFIKEFKKFYGVTPSKAFGRAVV